MSEDKYTSDFEELVQKELEIREDIAELQGNEDLSFTDLQQLISDIKTQLAVLLDKIKETKLKAEEDENDKIATRAKERIKGHQREHENLRASLRTATFKMKSNLDKRYERDRALLLEGNTEVRNRIMAQTKLDAIKQSSSLTEDLRKSRALLTGQVERSIAALQEIDGTNKMIDQTIQKHKKYNAIVRTGKGYLTKLKRREFTDRILIIFSLIVFLLVVLYIAKARLRFRIFTWLFGE